MNRILATLLLLLLPIAAGAQGTLPKMTFGAINGWAPSYIVSYGSSALSPTTGGSGYAPGDKITLANGTVLTVTGTSSGAVTSFIPSVLGTASAIPTSAQSQISTTGSGSGATFTLLWVPQSLGSTLPGLGGFNGITALGGLACNNLGNVALGVQCIGFGAGGAGLQSLDGLGGGGGLTGSENTLEGYNVGTDMQTAFWNTGIGHNCLGHEVDGSYNDCFGTDSQKFGLHNVSVDTFGVNTGKFLWNGQQILAQGYGALQGNNINPTISAIANNGSGAPRLTVSSTTGLTSNDAVFVANTNGTTGINTTGTPVYTTVIDGTHVDLQNVVYAAGYTGGGQILDMPLGFINEAVLGTASNAGVVELYVANTTNMYTGSAVHVAGVGGTTEANGNWTMTVVDFGCVGNGGGPSGTCRIDLQGSAYSHAWTSAGRITELRGPQVVSAIGVGALGSSNMTGHAQSGMVFGPSAANSATYIYNDTIIGAGVAATTFGTAGTTNHDLVVIAADGSTDVTTNASNSVGIGGGLRLAQSSVQIGTRAGFANTITSTARNDVLVGYLAGFFMTGPVAVTAVGQQVGSSVCRGPVNVLLLGTDYNTDCTSANESNVIHLGAGGPDVFTVTGTGTPLTSITTIAGILNDVAGYQSGGTAGVTCTGTPTASFTSRLGIVTHC